MSDNRNPLLQISDLPEFDKIQASHVVPAIRQILQDSGKEFERLEEVKEAGWESVMIPLERMGLKLSAVISPVVHLTGVKNSEELRKAYEEVQDEIVAFSLRINQSKQIYKKVKLISENEEFSRWSVARKRIVEKYLLNAKLSGITLEGDERKNFNELSTRLTQLSTDFSNNLLDATKNYFLILKSSSDIEGLPVCFLEMASQNYNHKFPETEKKSTSKLGPWLVTLDYPVYIPFMENSKRRDLREQVYRAFVTRASTGSSDNRPLIKKILRLRRKKSNLLGFSTYAELSLSKKMAADVEHVYQLLEDLRKASWDTAVSEVNELKSQAASAGINYELANWDVAYWAKRLQEEKFSFTDEELRPYLPLPGVLEGLFDLVHRLFSIQVEERSGEVSVWHSDVRFFRVFGSDGSPIAAFFLDPYSRPENKRGGAWMDECKTRHLRADGTLQMPVAYLVCNSTPPVDGRPSLLTFREVETLFHEFGHGLQHMLTQVDEADVSGINGVEWDAVELASQFMENWCYHRPTLMRMAKHYQTGETMPEDLYQKLLASRTFRAGFQMLRQVQISLLDLELHHSWDPDHSDKTPFDIQAEIAEKISVMKPLQEDQFLCSFSHIFAGGYAAGYYSYKWAEVLSADAFGAFEEVGLENEKALEEIGKKYRDTILAKGGGEHPMKVFHSFRGRNPEISALLRHTGLGPGKG